MAKATRRKRFFKDLQFLSPSAGTGTGAIATEASAAAWTTHFPGIGSDTPLAEIVADWTLYRGLAVSVGRPGPGTLCWRCQCDVSEVATIGAAMRTIRAVRDHH